MSVTNSSLFNLLRTSFNATSFHLCAVRDTHSSLNGLLCTSPMTATFMLAYCTMRDADSSVHDLIGTPLYATLFTLLLSAMCDTNPSLLDLVVASLESASFLLSAMCKADSSLHGSIDTSLLAAFLSSPYARLDTRLRFSDDRLFLRPLHLWDN